MAPRPSKQHKRLHTAIPKGEMVRISNKRPEFSPKIFMTNQCIWCGFSFTHHGYLPVCPECRSCQYCGLYSISDYACTECGNQFDDDCNCRKEKQKFVIF